MNRILTRRLFNAHLVAASIGITSGASHLHEKSFKKGLGDDRFEEICLVTSQSLKAMREFYTDLLGFTVEEENDDKISFRAGRSILSFKHSPGVKAFYHFAFNIPENQVQAAHDWQAERTELILPPANLNDEGHPRGVVAFRHWDAHSVFFWDPAGNAVEYIGRHSLDNAREGAFSSESVLSISEIGLVVRDVPDEAKRVKRELGWKTYVSSSKSFEPIGDEHGLLLIMEAGQPMAFGQGGSRAAFDTEVTLRHGTGMEFKEYPYRIRSLTDEQGLP